MADPLGWVALALAVAVTVPFLSMIMIIPGLIGSVRSRHHEAIWGYALALAIALLVAGIILTFQFAVNP